MTFNFKDNPLAQQRAAKVRQFLKSLRRAAVVCIILGAIYFTIVSALYPSWSFEFVWRKSFLDFNDGWLIALTEIKAHPYLISFLLVGIFCASLTAHRFWDRLRPLIDRFWIWLVLGSVMTFLVTTLVVYAREGEAHELMDHAIQIDDETIRRIDVFLSPKRPNIEAPVDFLYLNHRAVEALYNEIEPDLIERRRTIASTAKSAAKVGVAGEGLSADLSATKGRESTSSYERVESAVQRKCLQLMKFTLDEGRAKNYTDFTNWYAGYQLERLRAQRAFATGPITKEALESLRARTAVEEERIAQEQFHRELSQLTGLVFVNGHFSQGPATSEGSSITEEFTKKPKKVVFRIILPPSDLNTMPVQSLPTANLTVFGRVIKPLGEDSTIEIRALAIF
jgi:hypothetical protein